MNSFYQLLFDSVLLHIQTIICDRMLPPADYLWVHEKNVHNKHAFRAYFYLNECKVKEHKHNYGKNSEHDNQGYNFNKMNLILSAVGLTCVEVVEAAAAHSGSAGWPSGSSGVGRWLWGKVWGFPLSPRCPLSLP